MKYIPHVNVLVPKVLITLNEIITREVLKAIELILSLDLFRK